MAVNKPVGKVTSRQASSGRTVYSYNYRDEKTGVMRSIDTVTPPSGIKSVIPTSGQTFTIIDTTTGKVIQQGSRNDNPRREITGSATTQSEDVARALEEQAAIDEQNKFVKAPEKPLNSPIGVYEQNTLTGLGGVRGATNKEVIKNADILGNKAGQAKQQAQSNIYLEQYKEKQNLYQPKEPTLAEQLVYSQQTKPKPLDTKSFNPPEREIKQEEYKEPNLPAKLKSGELNYEQKAELGMAKGIVTLEQSQGETSADPFGDITAITVVASLPSLVRGGATVVSKVGSKLLSKETKSIAGQAAKLLKKTKFVNKPITVATVDKEGVLASTSFKVKVGKLIGKEYEITSDVRLTQVELENLIGKASKAPRINAPNVKKILPSKSGGYNLQKTLVEPPKVLQLEAPRVASPKIEVGSKVTDLINTNRDLVKFRQKIKGFNQGQINKLNESIGETILTKSEGIARIRRIGLVEKVTTPFKSNKGLIEEINIAKAKALKQKGVVTTEVRGLELTQVSGRKIVSPKIKTGGGVNVAQGNKLDIRRLTSKNDFLLEEQISVPKPKSGLPQLVSGNNLSAAVKKVVSEPRVQPVKVSLSGTKGKLISKELFEDKSILTSQAKKFITQDLSVEKAGQRVKLSRIKVEGLPEQKVLERVAKKPKVELGDDWQTKVNNKVKPLKIDELRKLGEPQKRLPAPKIGTVTQQEQQFELELKRLGLDNFKSNIVKPKNITPTLSNLPRSILRQSGRGLATLEQEATKTSTAVATGQGSAMLLNTVTKPKISLAGQSKTQSQSRTQTVEQPVLKQTQNFKGVQSVRQANLVSRVPRVTTVLLNKQVNATGTSFKQIQLQNTATNTMSNVAVAQAQQQRVNQATNQAIAQAQQTNQRQAQRFKQALAQQQIQRQQTQTRTRIQTIPKPIPIRPLTNFPKSQINKVLLKKKNSRLAFDVLVRRKGKFVKVRGGLPKNLALRLGSRVADVTTARTFRLAQSGFTNRPDVGSVNLNQFRQPFGKSRLRAPNTYIEKSKYAISSSEEKAGIPGKALALRVSRGFSLRNQLAL